MPSAFRLRLFHLLAALLLLCALPARAQEPAPQEPAPRAGEIRLDGLVSAFDIATRALSLEAASFTLPSGKSAPLERRKAKAVVLLKDAAVVAGGAPGLKLGLGDIKSGDIKSGDIKSGDSVAVIGKDAGAGAALAARVVILRPEGAAVKAPRSTSASKDADTEEFLGGDEDDFSEASLSQWAAFSSDDAPSSVKVERAHRMAGEQSIRFDSRCGYDTGVRFPASARAHWNLSRHKYFRFWVFGRNKNPFQGRQPVVVVKCRGGSFTYTPLGIEVRSEQWRQMWVTLGGSTQWARTSEGAPDLSDVHQVEIHQDTLDFGFTVFYDGLSFEKDKPALPPVERTLDPFVIEPKVLLIVIDPIQKKSGGVRTHQAFGWNNPFEMAPQVIADLSRSSHGRLRYQIVETVIIDEFPVALDGTKYSERAYLREYERRRKSFDKIDLKKILRENGVVASVERGDIDEVWIYAPPLGAPESVMVGAPGSAYWINSTPLDLETQRPFVVMVLNFERGVSEALHSFGHRTESIMSEMYGGWKQDGSGTTAWDKFAATEKKAPGQAGVGDVHFPPNGREDYDYAPPGSVLSSADDWYLYPDMKGRKRPVGTLDWVPNGVVADDPKTGLASRAYLNWWYDHLPHFAGRAPDGRLNNWWRYIADVAEFQRERSVLLLAENRYQEVPAVAINSPANGDEIALAPVVDAQNAQDEDEDVVLIRAGAGTEAPFGRVDFFVDGQLAGSDSVAPYTFEWNARRAWKGEHTLSARAHGLATRFEVDSQAVVVTVK